MIPDRERLAMRGFQKSELTQVRFACRQQTCAVSVIAHSGPQEKYFVADRLMHG